MAVRPRLAVTRRRLGFDLPVLRCPLVHEVVMDEAQDFEPRTVTWDAQPDPEMVLLQEVDARLRVELVIAPGGTHADGVVPRPYGSRPAAGCGG